MTIQDLGSLGELIAALATVCTLAYLAAQIRQNTQALRSATFQSISAQMGQNAEAIATSPELAELFSKAWFGSGDLTLDERIRFHSALVMTFRRLEAVFVQGQLGYIDKELMEGFDVSMISMLREPNAAQWWASAKVTFNPLFVAHVEGRLAKGDLPADQPSIGLPTKLEVGRRGG